MKAIIAKIRTRALQKTEAAPFLMSFPISEQILFAKRLGMILRSGTPILEGLYMLNDNVRSRSVAYIYTTLSAHIAKGQSLSSGLGKFSRQFGEFAVNIVGVGETTGTLPDNLTYLADELKKKQALRKKVIGALVYPIVIVIATLGITILLTVYIFPKITPIFQSFHTTLPLSTRILIAVSGFLINDGLWFFLGLIICAVGAAFLLRLKRVHYYVDRALLSLPILGAIVQYYNVVNITRTLGLLLRCDVRVVEAFEIIAKSTKNLVYREAMERGALHVLKGERITEQFKWNRQLFPSIVTQMISVGESTGNLSGSLDFCAEMYDEEISDLTKNLTNLLEPVLMIVMGVIVGFVAISIITPIYGITQNISP
jgi:type II secretory pathway component PulF